MNTREGFRRVGLVIGAAGACVGLFLSYIQIKDLLERKTQASDFQAVFSSPVVQKEVAFLKANGYLKASDWVDVPSPPPGYKLDPPNNTVRGPWDYYRIAGLVRGEGWNVHEENIKTLYFDLNQEVTSIEKEDDARVFRTSAPTVWNYLLPASFPLIGFLIPWGLIRILVWVASGFTKST